MYNRVYTYLAENNISFNKQFGFRAGHSTEHTLLELIDQISNSFNDISYFLGIFIDLLKAFDTADHKILLKKLQYYGIKGKNLSWFESYLTVRKQYTTLHNLYKRFMPGIRYLEANYVRR